MNVQIATLAMDTTAVFLSTNCSVLCCNFPKKMSAQNFQKFVQSSGRHFVTVDQLKALSQSDFPLPAIAQRL